MNLYSTIETHAAQAPDRTALVFAGERVRYGRFRQQVDSLSVGLRSLGMETGNRVALFMPNCPEMIFSFYGAMKLGLVAVSLNTMLRKDELEYILHDCSPDLLIVHHRLMHLVATLSPIKQTRMRVLVVGGDHDCGSQFFEFSALLAAHQNDSCPTLNLDSDTEAVIAYTSGTTGFPKGAVHCHGNLLCHLDEMAKHLGFEAGDTFLAALPLFQLPAFLIQAAMACHVGATLVIMEKFDPQPFIDHIHEETVTFFAGVPTIYQMLYDVAQDRKQQLNTVRFGICAGSPLSMTLRNNFENKLGLRIVHCYGSTETPLIAAFERPDESPKGISVGPASPHVPLRVVTHDGRDARPGEAGEIQIGADNSLKRYWKNPEATRLAIRNGWLRTGDIGRFDDEGHLHIVDRSKDMIIRGGFNIYPAEIERVLLQDPGIREAVVVGGPHPRLGQVPKAYIVLEKDVRRTAQDVIAMGRKHLAAYKTIEAVEFVDESFFPRNAMGKILKNKIKRGKNEAKNRQ